MAARKILFATDYSTTSQHALTYAASLAAIETPRC